MGDSLTHQHQNNLPKKQNAPDSSEAFCRFAVFINEVEIRFVVFDISLSDYIYCDVAGRVKTEIIKINSNIVDIGVG